MVGLTDANNVALGKNVTMSSLYTPGGGDWSHAVDGNPSGDWFRDYSCACTNKDDNPWLLLDLEDTYTVTAMKIYNRVNCCRK